MQIVMAVACDSAVEYAGRLSLLGTFDTLETDHFPLVKAQCSLAIQIRWDNDEEGLHTVRVHFMDQDGRTVLHDLKAATLVKVPPGHNVVTTTTIINLQQVRFPKDGCSLIEILVDERIETEIQIQIHKV
jgi:hypothetical protein